ncbi:uncharacterized protein MELLADRAFT_105250 [Melampsora larici-populina 98AG31]|uniref:Rad51-like C-terminal domain-containing protein n=1 Tax=Melampsora larici-populina (strain 98AG31 / pathotype 3-4-7) TaxID=747676 RepID=F4RHC5_MELLP|nr:uncharacterized protein MELLADRAFT_105250 [Melampsora larici-populina 98AG31]EGG08271.1 hypothetical protein MELLADRAFT_105250 [Melampsora larici-populina 98AG31]
MTLQQSSSSPSQNPQAEEEEDQNQAQASGPIPIAALAEHGFSSSDIQKLITAGNDTVEAIAYQPRKSLIAIKGISEAKADKLQFRKGRDTTRIVKVIDSPCLPEGETKIALCQNGIGDPEED